MNLVVISILISLDSADPLSSSHPCNDPPPSLIKVQILLTHRHALSILPTFIFLYGEEKLDADHSLGLKGSTGTAVI